MPLVVIAMRGRGSSAAMPAHDVDQAAAQQRLAAGEPHLGDAEPDHDADDRTSSSSVSISGLGSQSRPSAGMQ